MRLSKLNRSVHRWGSLLILLPAIVIFTTGLILQVKKEFTWIQPPTRHGSAGQPSISFEQILAIARAVPEAEIETWDDVDRLDVRPGRSLVKVRANNRWEIQIDAATGELLQVAYRRSDLIESLHDGSFFHEKVKLWAFLPTAIFLIFLWATGVYLFVLPYYARWSNRRRKALEAGRSG